MFTIYDRLAIFHKICSTTSYTIMEPQDETMFNKPEEPHPKTPTPYEEDSERPAKVQKVYGEKPEKMMSVLRKKQSNSFLGNMMALHDAQSSPDVCWWEGDIGYHNSKFLMVEDTCFPPQYTTEDKQEQLVN